MSWTVELESPASAHQIFYAGILDWHNLGPKIAPEVLESGTDEGIIRQLNFTSAMPFTHVKERMDFVDHETLECETTITEGGHLGTKLESATVNYKIAETATGEGCNIKVLTTTKPLPGIELDDGAAEAISKAKEAMVNHFKIVGAYLLANPDKYDAAPPSNKLIADDDDDDDDAVLVEGDGGESHPRYFAGRQSNGIVGGNAVQQGSYGGYFGGIQANGIVYGDAVQQNGGTYNPYGGGFRPNFNPGWGYAYGRGGY